MTGQGGLLVPTPPLLLLLPPLLPACCLLLRELLLVAWPSWPSCSSGGVTAPALRLGSK